MTAYTSPTSGRHTRRPLADGRRCPKAEKQAERSPPASTPATAPSSYAHSAFNALPDRARSPASTPPRSTEAHIHLALPWQCASHRSGVRARAREHRKHRMRRERLPDELPISVTKFPRNAVLTSRLQALADLVAALRIQALRIGAALHGLARMLHRAMPVLCQTVGQGLSRIGKLDCKIYCFQTKPCTI